MSILNEHRFELPDSEFQCLAQALREHLVGVVNDRGSPPSFVQINLPYHLAPPLPDDEIYEESLQDGRFVEMRQEETVPLPVQQLKLLLRELQTQRLPQGPECRVLRRGMDSSRSIEVVLSWQ